MLPSVPQPGVTIEGKFDPAGRGVDIGRGVEWLVDGWRLFIAAPGVWVAISALVLVACFLVSLVPVIGGIALSFLLPVAFAGMLAGCRELARGGPLRVDHLFIGFQGRDTGNLVMV